MKPPKGWVQIGLYEARLIRDAGHPVEPPLDPELDAHHVAGVCFTTPRIAAVLPLVTGSPRSVALLMLDRALRDDVYEGLLSAMNLAAGDLNPVVNALYEATFDPEKGGTATPLALVREIEGRQKP